ncbi:MAG TPA: aquaporin Z [Polyangiaceae bacterium]|nr:aquaporin Z [Polyangiaceae bacterium]
MRKLVAESLGTFILVFGGCGSAVFSAAFPDVGIGLLGVSLAFGLTVLGCAYALGSVSGCHLNPAVTLGLCAAKRFEWKDAPGYIVAQVLGAVAAARVLLSILQSVPGGYDPLEKGLAANGFGEHSPGGFGFGSAALAEFVLTFIFLTVILGATSKRSSPGFAGLAIGLTLTLVHLVGIPITNLSVNPARSTGPAVFVGGWAMSQLWIFWIAPIAGAFAAGLLGSWLHEETEPEAAAPVAAEIPPSTRGT